MNQLVLSLFATISILSTSGFAKPKSVEEHWQEVGWKFSQILEKFLEEKTCYKTEKDFFACMHGLNAMIQHAKKGMKLAVAEIVNNEKEKFGKVEETFGPVVLVANKPFGSKSTAELYEHNKKMKKLSNEGWSTLYSKRKESIVPFKEIINFVSKQKAFTANESFLTASGMNAVLNVIRDPHTLYTPTALAKEDEQDESFVGIGISIGTTSKDGNSIFRVDSVIGKSPAEAAGIKSGDLLKIVDGKKTANLSFEDLLDLIKGEAGSTIKITITREGMDKEISIVRKEITIENTESSFIKDFAVPVGHVIYRSFMKEKGCEALKKKIQGVEKTGAKALVFDLRDNGGGFLTEAQCVANIFLGNRKEVVSVKPLGKGRQKTFRTTKDALTQLPTIVLVNAGSASASELVSGALQDHKRAFILGERTFGKGTVQDQEEKGKVTFISTIARFLLPSGRTNQIEGIIPDLTVHTKPNPTPDDLVAFREEDEYAALPAIGTPWKQTRPESVKELSKCLSESGQASKLYEKALKDGANPDHQLLIAAEAAACVAEGKPASKVNGETPQVIYRDFPDEKPTAIGKMLEAL